MVQMLEVSKSSVREAVKVLEAMNVVEIKKGKGTFVRSSTPAQVINPLLFSLLLQQGANDEIYELRRMFEPAYTLLAMQKALPEDIEHIKQTLQVFKEAVDNGAQSVKMDVAFHKAILDATHNDFVIKIGEVIMQLFVASIGMNLSSDPKRSVEMHENIYQSLIMQDSERLLHWLELSFRID
jgi:GntR family transcriptional repressor for pyruvate dehydrogenase complex